MADQELSQLKELSSRLNRYIYILVIGWTLAIGLSFASETRQHRINVLEVVKLQNWSTYNKDLAYRRWAAKHGGVYVPITEKTPPNPYLSHIPERDIETPSGKKLTLVNPAYMTRQVFEISKEQYGLQAHITSLKPLNPNNGPDPWERKALIAFEEGAKEITEVSDIDGEPYMRLMMPMFVETSCMKCHEKQGYKVGEVRGGLSISARIRDFMNIADKNTAAAGREHLALWFIGVIGIFFIGRRFNKQLHAHLQTEENFLRSQTRYKGLFENSPIATLEEDFSAIKEKLDALKEQGVKNLEEHIKNTPDFLSDCVKDISLTNINHVGLQLFKVKDRQELINNSESIFTKSSYTIFETLILAIWNQKTHAQAEGSCKTIDGDVRNIQVTWTVHTEHEGDLSSTLVTIVDITHRIAIDDALYFVANKGLLGGGKEFFQALVEYLAKALDVEYALIDVLANKEGTIARTIALYADGTFPENIEYSLVHTPCANVMGHSICCYPHSLQQSFPKDELLVQMGAESYAGIPLWGANGKPIGLIAVMGKKPLKNPELAEALLQVVSVRAAHEIERRSADELIRESARRLSEAQKIAKLGNWELNLETNELYWSDEIYRMFEVSKDRYVPSYETFLSFVYPDDKDQVEKTYKESVEKKIPYEIVHRIITPSGEVKYIHQHSKLVMTDEEKVVRSIGTVMDITKLKEAEIALQELNKSLEERILDEVVKSRQKDQVMFEQSRHSAMAELLVNLAHQWRQPISAIGMIAQDIEDAYDHEELDKKYLESSVKHITDEVEELSRTINHFRTFFIVESKEQNFSLKENIEKAYDLLKDAFERFDIEFTFDVQNDAIVRGYPNQFSQAIYNILNNAKEVSVDREMEKGKIKVELQKSEKTGKIQIIISDNCGGIDDSILENIFDPYSTTRHKARGKGLGLFMAKSLIENNMHGSLRVESNPEGASFIIEV